MEVGSTISQGTANSGGGTNLLFGIFFAKNCIKMTKMDWGRGARYARSVTAVSFAEPEIVPSTGRNFLNFILSTPTEILDQPWLSAPYYEEPTCVNSMPLDLNVFLALSMGISDSSLQQRRKCSAGGNEQHKTQVNKIP